VVLWGVVVCWAYAGMESVGC